MKTTLLFVIALLLCASSFEGTRAQELASARPASDKSEAAPRDATRVPGSIKGRILDESGQPLPNIGISAMGRGGASRASATTDESGSFSLDNLEPGLYTLVFQLFGYTFTRDPLTGLSESSVRRRVGDFVNIRLTRGGVITGRVTDAEGNPVVAVGVRAHFMRRLDDPPGSPALGGARESQTDDRGVYRIYGLASGVYVVSTGGPQQMRSFPPSPFVSDTPTYFPSATRDTASEISLREGQEATGIDIRYRGEQGRIVSGKIESITAGAPEQFGISVSLVRAASGAVQGQATVSGFAEGGGFQLDGVPDGDYEITARRFSRGDGDVLASQPQKVSVRGADVVGLRLTLAPLASVAGTVALEPLSAEARTQSGCADARAFFPEETSIFARLDVSTTPSSQADSRLTMRAAEATVDTAGTFTMRGLTPGRYRMNALPASEEWYVRAISLAPAPKRTTATVSKTPARTAAEAPAAESLQLASGQKATGVRVFLAEGASSIRGRVMPVAPEGQEAPALPPRMRVYLVPTERERADDPLRYHESAANDATFTFTNIAPGRYLLLARPDADSTPTPARKPAAWDASSRRILRRDAEAANLPVELRPCQRIVDHALRFSLK